MSICEVPIWSNASRIFAFFEFRMARMLSTGQVLICMMSLCYAMGSDAICVSVFRWSGEGLVSTRC